MFSESTVTKGTYYSLFNDFERFSKEEMCSTLKDFYASVRNKKGEYYSKKSMISIRYGIQKHIAKIREFDVVNDPAFKPANVIFNAMLVKLKGMGLAAQNHKSPVSEEDLGKMYTYFDVNTPCGLQNKVFLDFMIYFCNRGRENLRALKKSDFKFYGHGPSKYVQLRDHSTKNHKGDSAYDTESQGGRLFVTPSNPLCPVKSLEKYMSHLHIELDCFWQRPRQSDKLKPGDDIWYEKIPVGRNTLGNKMKDMSEQFGLSKKYTNHCLRTTAITLLDQDGFEAREIMAVSGHRSENSIRSYSRTDEGKKRKMSSCISDAISKSVAPATKVSKDDRADLHLAVPRLDNAEQNNINPVLQDQRGPVDLETDLADMDFLELSSSQEHVLMQSLSKLQQITKLL
ncbi:KCTD1_15 [Mytilus coruscus]|uniref:KCTD1_15 n=1 Tax=Mytilus coruscus TaxID=42192 RepID=A0A6J8DTP8_MYTCO|nr:KCTD1_15 [Mytilus coruscus]